MRKIITLGIAIISILMGTHVLAAGTTPPESPEPGATTDRYDAGNEGFGKNTKKKVSGVNTISTKTVDASNGSRILDTVQTAINRVLGMLSFVALILCLWGGFQMLTAAGDDGKVKSGTKILKNAAIGLAVIGLSWLVVSFVFRIINKVTNNS